MKLYRGPRNLDELNSILSEKTAGGKCASEKPRKPSEEELKTYECTIKVTAGECMPPEANQHIETEFTEYTLNENVAISFGRRVKGERYMRGAYICIEVDEAYIVRFENDNLENGVLIRSDTPVQSVNVIAIY